MGWVKKTKQFMAFYGSPYKARIQNGISGSYMDAIFDLPHKDCPFCLAVISVQVLIEIVYTCSGDQTKALSLTMQGLYH